MDNYVYQNKPSKGAELAKSASKQTIGTNNQTVTETNIWEDGKDVIRRFKPTPFYTDPAVAAQGGVEQMLFGGGPNLQAHQANLANAQLFQNYQQMGMPNITPAQAKLKQRVLGTKTTSEQSVDQTTAETAYNQFKDKTTAIPLGFTERPMVMVGSSVADDTIHEFLPGVNELKKSDWDKMKHWDFLTSLAGGDKKAGIDEWKKFKDYMKPYIEFSETKDGVRIITRGGNAIGMDPRAADILNVMLNSPLMSRTNGGSEAIDPKQVSDMSASFDDHSYNISDVASQSNNGEVTRRKADDIKYRDGDSGTKHRESRINAFDSPSNIQGKTQMDRFGLPENQLNLLYNLTNAVQDSASNANQGKQMWETTGEKDNYNRELGRLYTNVEKTINLGRGPGTAKINARNYWDEFLEKEGLTTASFMKLQAEGRVDWAGMEQRLARLIKEKEERQKK